MSHKKNRGLKFVEGLGFVALSIGSAGALVVLASVTVFLVMTLVGIPLALMTAVGAGACAAGTFVFADRAGHKFAHAFGEDEYEYRRQYRMPIRSVSSHFAPHQTEQKNLSNSMLNNNSNDMSASTKPLFVSASPKRPSDVLEMSSVSSTINDDGVVARAGA